MTHFVCATCGTQFPASDAPPPACPICEDERQYVPEDGQRWTTLEELGEDHRNGSSRRRSSLVGIGTEPSFAIGQRALLVPYGDRQPDVGLHHAARRRRPRRRSSGAAGSPGSRSPTRTTTRRWSSGRSRFDCPIYLHAADRRWVMRPDPAVDDVGRRRRWTSATG